MSEEDLIDRLFARIVKRGEEREETIKLSKGARIKHRGQVLEVYLIPRLPLSDGTATITIHDVNTNVEVSTLDLYDPNMRYLDLTYGNACEIYDKILERSEVIEVDLKKVKAIRKPGGKKG